MHCGFSALQTQTASVALRAVYLNTYILSHVFTQWCFFWGHQGGHYDAMMAENTGSIVTLDVNCPYLIFYFGRHIEFGDLHGGPWTYFK